MLNYQINKLSSTFQDDDFFNELECIEPTGLLAPYFFMPQLDDWLDFNLALYEMSDAINPSTIHIYPVICFDYRFLESERFIERLIKGYSTLKTDGFFLWISNMDETNLGEISLQNLMNIMTVLSAGEKKVFNMYGGFYLYC